MRRSARARRSRPGGGAAALRALAGLSLLAAGACHAADATEARHGALAHGGHERTYRYWLPPDSFVPPHPLVISLHGRFGTGDAQQRLTDSARLAARGAIVVAPDGIDRSWNDARGEGPAARAGIDDVAFVGALVDELAGRHGADPERVFVMGMSNGGFLALTLACRAAERVKAVAAVTAQLSRPLEGCAPAAPVRIAIVAGTEDPLVPFGGGRIARGETEILPARDSALRLARALGCAEEPGSRALEDVDPADGTRTTLETWSACRPGAEVRLYTVSGGGHTWPGGAQYLPKLLIGRTARDFSATDEAADFFGLPPR